MAKKDRFDYQGEKLHQARRTLMAPHSQGEDLSYAFAFDLCRRAFHGFDESRIQDQNAREWIKIIKETMNTDGVDDPTGQGTFFHKAQSLSFDERLAFSNAVDELASWLSRHFWSDH